MKNSDKDLSDAQKELKARRAYLKKWRKEHMEHYITKKPKDWQEANQLREEKIAKTTNWRKNRKSIKSTS